MNGLESEQQVWLVTGASKGIGRDIVDTALEHGSQVIAGSRHPEQVSEWTAEHGLQNKVLSVFLDVTDETSVAEAVRAGVEKFGRIDVLVNNAGYLLYGGIEELSNDEVQRSFGVNVFGLLNVTRSVLAVMRGQGVGHVINMASISANITSAATGLYSSTKAAVLMLTEALADEGRDIGVRATAICPGGVRTDFLDSSSAQRADHVIEAYSSVHHVEEALDRSNHRQGGDPRRVAEAIVAVANMDHPPRRLYLGEDALEAITENQSYIMQEVQLYQQLSKSTTG